MLYPAELRGQPKSPNVINRLTLRYLTKDTQFANYDLSGTWAPASFALGVAQDKWAVLLTAGAPDREWLLEERT